jgi:hypothetical protein
MMKYNTGRIIAAGVAFAVIAQIVHGIGANLTMGFYLMEEYFPVWSKIMMPAASAPPMSFFYYSIAFGIITGIIYAAVYTLIKNSVPGKKAMNKGLNYGLLLFLISVLPGSLSMYLLINLPSLLIVYWAIESLVVSVIGGIIIAWLNK